jgi:hypothetical protein
MVKVVAAYAYDGSDFRARPGVLLPLIATGVAMAPGSPTDPVFVTAVCRKGEPVIVTTCRDCPVDGDEYVFEPPLVVPPTLVAAQTAARLAAGSFVVEQDRVVVSWPPR